MTSSEQEFLNNYHPEDYEKPSVAVDLLVFTIEEAALKLVMIRREEMPFQNKLALPGVFVNIRESLEEAAYRGIEEETGLTDIYLEQLYTWGAVSYTHLDVYKRQIQQRLICSGQQIPDIGDADSQLPICRYFF